MCKDTSPEYIIQEFSKFSASLSSIANVGLRTIQGYIDKYSLLFLGRLHSSDQNSLNNQIYRFISDVHVTEKKIASKSLLQTVKKYQLFDVFSKIVKKRKKINKKYSKMVIKKIWAEEEKQWRATLSVNLDMVFFR